MFSILYVDLPFRHWMRINEFDNAKSADNYGSPEFDFVAHGRGGEVDE